MLTQLFDTANTIVLAVPQPEAVQPPGGEKMWRIIGVALWVFTGMAVLGIITGGGWMWIDHMSDRGATSGKGVKIVIGAFIGAGIMSLAATLITFAQS